MKTKKKDQIIRSSKVRLKHANKGKLKNVMNYYFDQMIDDIVNYEINKVLYDEKRIKAKPEKSYTDNIGIKATRKAQLVAKEISSTVRSCLAKIDKAKLAKNKSKYQQQILNKFHNGTLKIEWQGHFNIDDRFIDIQVSNNSEFDYWLVFNLSQARHEKTDLPRTVQIPIYKTRHMRKLEDDGFVLKPNALKICRNGYIHLFYYKEKDLESNFNTTKLGIDVNFEPTYATSKHQKANYRISQVLTKISKQKNGSKAKQTSIRKMQQLVDRSVKQINLTKIKEVVMEDLTDMKYDSPLYILGKKYHHWSYSYIQNRIHLHAEKQDVLVRYVNPAYTSQICNLCDVVHKGSRKGDLYLCTSWGVTMCAHTNAAINLSRR